MAPAMDKLQKIRADLAEANPNSAVSSGETPEGLCTSFSQLSQELKRLKFFFIDGESQRQFAAFAASGRRLTEEPPDGDITESQRKTAKEKNQALKQRIDLELQLHTQLVMELAEANRKATDLYEQCQQDLKDAEAAEASSEEALDLQLVANRFAETLDQSGRGADQGPQEVRQLWVAREEMAVKRRRLDEEIRNSEAQCRQNALRSAALAQAEKHELDLIQSYEQLSEAEEKLGLPKLEIDHARGVALLGEPPGKGTNRQEDCFAEAESLRRIEFEFDRDGALCKAEAHPALGLQQIASKAVARQDLGFLATLAWARLNGAL
eukprot:TRINITY_DN59940_c0_g1_i1.p1 TRINITY_DN59940_c0_g1~~TRINITY_DN59940_c0_g1_i1.p1  ORF type:complete len:323 (-),score=80.31 TRINITY_DN59940_c0_g1_i1:100-1068(-)